MPSHYDLTVLIAVCFGVGFTGLVALGWMVWDTHKSVKHGERMTRAVAALVVQETEKIRTLMAD